MTAMPKVVDHEERRTELAAAVWRLASRDGLEAVTVRRVAEEAGWSTGAVVHYFADKEDLLLFAFSTVADRVRTRLAEARFTVRASKWEDEIAGSGGGSGGPSGSGGSSSSDDGKSGGACACVTAGAPSPGTSYLAIAVAALLAAFRRRRVR